MLDEVGARCPGYGRWAALAQGGISGEQAESLEFSTTYAVVGSRRWTFETEVLRGSNTVGKGAVEGVVLPTERLSRLRALKRRRRNDQAPRWVQNQEMRLDPGPVGRARPDNVLLADFQEKAGTTKAVLSIPLGHATIYDPPLDHVPGQALVDAVLQPAHLHSGNPGPIGWLDLRPERAFEVGRLPFVS